MRKERRGAPGGRQNAESYLVVHKSWSHEFRVQTDHEDESFTWLSQYQALQFYPKAAVCDYGAHPDFLAFLTESTTDHVSTNLLNPVLWYYFHNVTACL